MTLALAILALLHGPPSVRARMLGPLYARSAAAHGVRPALLARVCGHESGDRIWKLGDYRYGRPHAFGLCQLHRDGLPRRLFTRAELLRPDVNADAAATHLARDLRLCHGRIAAAVARYQRGHGCAPSDYSARVLFATVAP